MSKVQKNNQTLLSICITSYKRINELKRCLKSIDTLYVELIEIIVSEDHSELREEIRLLVEGFSKASQYFIRFNSNEVNLGYDRNLAKLISLAKGKHIIYISDDDYFVAHALDELIEFIQSNECNVAFVPTVVGEDNTFGRKYSQSMKINKGIKSVKRHLYDPILFSGLIFKRDLVYEYSADRFLNLIYFQVYLFMSVLYNYDGYYIDIPTICNMSDGENAFGISDSSQKNEFLANRESIHSMIEFHKGLIKVIQIFDEDNGTNVIQAFEKEYSLRTYAGLSTAQKAGKKEFKIYWDKLNALDIQLTIIVKIYYWSLNIFGSNICDVTYDIPKKLLLMFRY